jgi:transcriptional regulator GlxA family with amidase domain
LLQWLRRIGSAPETDVLMSVCTGAFKLADAGLLEGKHATTHHDFLDEFARRYPAVTLERGRRYVQSAPHLFTAGGLTSGIDLALHVVALYYGEATAQDVARYMEYRQGHE